MEKQRWEESGGRSQEVRISEKRKSEKQEDAGAQKVGKSRFTVFFPLIWGSEGVEVYSTSAFCFQTDVDVAYCSLLILL